MKRFSLLSLVALVFAVVYACSDSTAPANSNGLLAPTSPVLRGDPPPPPVDAAITITISSVIHASGPFDGVYFGNGKTAWLRLDNTQSEAFETRASDNARFMRSNGDNLFGRGTLTIEGHVVVITKVTSFTDNPDCLTTGEFCAFIMFDATVDDETGHTGTAEAFDKGICELITPNEGNPYYRCGEG